jgi:hypothetical protein
MADSGILSLSVDLNDVEAPAPLPVGSYLGEIIAAEWKVSQSSGNTYCAFMFRINSDQYPADYTEGDPDGINLSYNRLLKLDTPQVRYRWKKFAQACGAPLSRNIDPMDYIGLNARLEVTHDTYEGETRAQISRVLAA